MAFRKLELKERSSGFRRLDSPVVPLKKKGGFLSRWARRLAPKSVERFAETLGTAAAIATGTTRDINEAAVREAESRFRLAQQLRTATPEQATRIRTQLKQAPVVGVAEEQIEAIGKTGREVAGEALGVLGTAAIAAAPAISILGRLGFGATVGAGAGLKTGLEDKEADFEEVLKRTGIGAATGLAISGVFEGLGTILRRLANTRAASRIAGRRLNKELSPVKGELEKAIANDWKTFGETALDVVDDAGKPVYVGGYRTLLNKAKGELSTTGNKLMQRASQYDDVIGTRSEAAGDVVQNMIDDFGKLNKSQLKAIEAEVRRMPTKMNVTEMINWKRKYDSLIPDSFWVKEIQGNTPVATRVKYYLRDNLRRLINEKTGDEVIKQLNQRLGIAMDMKKLSASSLASREIKKGSFSTALWRLIDDTILNPAVTTRVAAGIKGAGAKTGITPIRAGVRTGLIEALVSEMTK